MIEVMGFTRRDLEEQQGILPHLNLDRIRWGPRIQPRTPIHIPGLPDLGQKPTRQKKGKKPPPDPGVGRFQQRLPGF